MVIGPVSAFIQSAREKKSPCTLSEPQKVQTKGKAANITHSTTKPVDKMTSGLDLRCAATVMGYALLRLKSRQVRISTGVNKIATPKIVRTDVAAADPNCCTSPRRCE